MYVLPPCYFLIQKYNRFLQLLEQRIQTFINTGEQLLANRHLHSPHIEHHVEQLKERWNDFKKQVESTRRLIDLSIQYFQLVDEVSAYICRVILVNNNINYLHTKKINVNVLIAIILILRPYDILRFKNKADNTIFN